MRNEEVPNPALLLLAGHGSSAARQPYRRLRHVPEQLGAAGRPSMMLPGPLGHPLCLVSCKRRTNLCLLRVVGVLLNVVQSVGIHTLVLHNQAGHHFLWIRWPNLLH